MLLLLDTFNFLNTNTRQLSTLHEQCMALLGALLPNVARVPLP